MACLDMYNSNEHKGTRCPPMSPRISFSNDFVDSQQIIKQERIEAPVSTDFEFSVTNYSMMSADELFFKGRLLPFKDNGGQRTIRDELLLDDDDDEDEVSLRPPKGGGGCSTKWKGLLGLKRSHVGSKKVDKGEGSSERLVGETRRSRFIHEEVQYSQGSQEILSEGGPARFRDVEIGT